MFLPFRDYLCNSGTVLLLYRFHDEWNITKEPSRCYTLLQGLSQHIVFLAAGAAAGDA